MTGTDTDVSSLQDVAAIEARISTLESTVETLIDRLDDLFSDARVSDVVRLDAGR